LVVTNWQNEMKGSGRSVSGLDMGSLMHKALHKGMLLKGGGHAMAAGFTVAPEMYNNFYDFLDNFSKPILDGRALTLNIDGFISIDSLNLEFANELAKLEPYGSGHPSPTVAIKNVRAVFCDVVGEQHIRLTLQDETGKRIKAIAFRSVDTPLKELLEYKGIFDVAGSFKVDQYQGSPQLQMIIDDVMLS
jgi:single-stranded-DNA-specific exonuclease